MPNYQQAFERIAIVKGMGWWEYEDSLYLRAIPDAFTFARFDGPARFFEAFICCRALDNGFSKLQACARNWIYQREAPPSAGLGGAGPKDPGGSFDLQGADSKLVELDPD